VSGARERFVTIPMTGASSTLEGTLTTGGGGSGGEPSGELPDADHFFLSGLGEISRVAVAWLGAD